jgi:signal transduction histidine kinase
MNLSSRRGAGYLYEGRYVRVARLAGLAIIVGTSFIGQPRPSGTGDGLVILIALVVAVAAQLVATVFPSSRWALARTVLGAVGSGVLVGYEPTIGTEILMVFVGLDIGASLEFAPGAVVTALSMVTTAIAILASGHQTSDISLGTVAFVGFLAAAGRKQYILRTEEAELRLADAERAREEHVRSVGLVERANAAREIHDILAHSLGALVLQLDALDAVMSTETPDHQRMVELVARARGLAVAGLGEARQAVGTLRSDPPPLIDALRQVVDTTDGATLEISGAPRATSTELAIAVRRTVQEGLANATKHAPGAAPKVHLTFTPERLVLSVSDPGREDGSAPGPLAHTGGGYGIEGLRERAELIGGTLDAGPDGAGWRVTLCVPEGQ